MKHTALKSSLFLILAVVLAAIVGKSTVSAQYYQMKVRTFDGQITSFNVESVDSVYFEPRTMPVGEAVDLGLSVKWASFNVGASKPEDYGNYYAWGETETKTDYNWSTYKYCNGSYDTQTKYSTNKYYGMIDNNTTLDLEDDAAQVNWGGSWRMPTKDEFTELLNNCTWLWTTINGVNGYLVTSMKSGFWGESIFLPAAGDRADTSLRYVGSYGLYWSSSLHTNTPYDAWYLGFYKGFQSENVCLGRYEGLSVRPVCP